MTRERIQGHLCILGANIIFGTYIPVSKFVLTNYFSSEVITFLRMFGAMLLFWIASFGVKNDKVSWRDIFLMAFFSLVGIVMNQWLFIFGLSLTSPVDASVIVTATPLMVMILAALFLRDPITRRKGSGVALGASGALWLIFSTNNIANSTGTWQGDMLILSSGLATALYYTFSKPVTSRHSPITLMKWMFFFATISMLPFSGDIFCSPDSVKAMPDIFGSFAILYIVVGATFISYLLIAMAIKRMRPTTMAMYNYLQPFIASNMAVFIGQDTFSIQKICAACLIFFGVYLVTSAKSPALPQESESR